MVYAPDGVGAFNPQFHMWGYVEAIAVQRYRGVVKYPATKRLFGLRMIGEGELVTRLSLS